jgi:hypothetical protein
MSVIFSDTEGRPYSANPVAHTVTFARVVLRRETMIECKEIAGKVIHLCTIFEDGSYGPDLQIDFTDGTSFTVSLKTDVSIEAKCIRNEGGQPQVLTDYTTPAIPR